MLFTGKSIVLNTIKYGETGVIARCYTRDHGLVSFMVKGVRGKGKIRPSHLLPLNLTEMVYQIKGQVSLQFLKEVKCDPVLQNIHYQPVKSAIVFFVTEMVHLTLREEEKNEPLFEFLWNSIRFLDLTPHSCANFPLYFLIQYSRFLGFYPDTVFGNERVYFEPISGHFAEKQSLHSLGKEDSERLFRLLTCGFDNFHEPEMNYQQRQILLKELLNYYRMHLLHFRELTSPEILHEVLAG